MKTHSHLKMLAGTALVLVACLITLGVSTASSDNPSPHDMAAITSVIDTWVAANVVSWPSDDYSSPSLRPSAEDAIDSSQAAAAADTATTDFADARAFSWAGFLQETRDVTGEIVVKSEYKLLGVTFVTRTELGDVVVRVPLWFGSTFGKWSTDKGAIVDLREVDTTPVDEYVLRKVGDGWRLLNVRHVELSEDDSAALYGPETPHSLSTADGDWLVGQQ